MGVSLDMLSKSNLGLAFKMLDEIRD